MLTNGTVVLKVVEYVKTLVFSGPLETLRESQPELVQPSLTYNQPTLTENMSITSLPGRHYQVVPTITEYKQLAQQLPVTVLSCLVVYRRSYEEVMAVSYYRHLSILSSSLFIVHQ